ncbi:MAG: acyl CoA:acetate/3-ketoacid CoA transferase [Alicyclobacillaceae bacterium]|nr:acyl CoA:acetate/3-ketoacid CoA transferase [Alicyclobacillaceae bacterium]
MGRGKVVTVQEAMDLIPDGGTLALVGFTLMGACECILTEIEQRFLTRGTPRGLTLVHAAGQSDRVRGLEHLAHPGLLDTVIGSHWGLAPRMSELIHSEQVAAFCLPQGQIVHLFRAMASGKPGNLSKVGLGTFVDPRVEGGKINRRAKQSGRDLVDVVTIKGEEYLFYNPIPLDTCLIRATTADLAGNCTMEEEAVKLEAISVAQAVKRYGGKVIVQAKYLADAGTLHPKQVVVPGIYVDAVVVAHDPETNHRQTSCAAFDPVFTGDVRVPETALTPLPLALRKLIGRRGALELYPGAVVNLGTGIPGDTIGPIAQEEGIGQRITLTIESGVIGGVPMGGVDFGIAKNPEAIIEHAYQFDYYNGTGVDVTFMGLAECDRFGNVNVSRFGSRVAGCGGFIDITQPAKKCVFLGTFTNGGLEVAVEDGRLRIVQEGRTPKFVADVSQITYSGEYARRHNKSVLWVTERAVFELREEGMVLTEVAPGVDIERDILRQMAFRPAIAKDLKVIDARVYRDGPMGIASDPRWTGGS